MLAIASACSLSFALTGRSSHSLVSNAAVRLPPISMATSLSQDELKKMVGYKAVDDYVKSGMVIGLGTGSTAAFAVERVGQLLKEGKLTDIVAIPTSVRTKEQAESLNIPLTTLDEYSELDVAIDGADEVRITPVESAPPVAFACPTLRVSVAHVRSTPT